MILTTPYFIPDEPLLQAMQTAVMRGAQVDVVLPRESDQWLVSAAGRAYFQTLIDIGANVHLHTQGLLHAKLMTVDDAFALVGSGNFDIRSFYLNFELNMLLYGPGITANLRFLQRQYIGQSVPLDRAAWAQRSSFKHFVDDVAKLLSPLL